MTAAPAGPARTTGQTQRLRVVGGRRQPDRDGARRAVADLLLALGRDPTKAGLAETPRRVADTYAELLTPLPFDLTTFPNDSQFHIGLDHLEFPVPRRGDLDTWVERLDTLGIDHSGVVPESAV